MGFLGKVKSPEQLCLIGDGPTALVTAQYYALEFIHCKLPPVEQYGHL